MASTLKAYEKLSKLNQYAAGLEMLSTKTAGEEEKGEGGEEGKCSMSVLLLPPC